MNYVCDNCGDRFQSTKGLNTHHRLHCVALAEQEASLPTDALELYRKRKREKKRRRLQAERDLQTGQSAIESEAAAGAVVAESMQIDIVHGVLSGSPLQL